MSISPAESTESELSEYSSIYDTSGTRSPQIQEEQSSQISQNTINYVGRCLHQLNIRSRSELIGKIDLVVNEILKNPQAFDLSKSPSYNFEILKKSIQRYNRNSDHVINLKKTDIYYFAKSLNTSEQRPIFDARSDELSEITKNYDSLVSARRKIFRTSDSIYDLLEDRNHVVVPSMILGVGDTATTIWLEKYGDHHQKTTAALQNGNFPEVLLIGENFGSWKHDYTLAQPHSLLERIQAIANPQDFTSQESYVRNSCVNARHLYQANLINLAGTDAPILLGYKVVRIEKRENHEQDWLENLSRYRMIILTPKGEKAIYTDSIDICTGLGPSKIPFTEDIISKEDLKSLSHFSQTKGFTPIVDGNQFILSDSEEHGPPRSILIYGGGGTAAAVFRKAFFNTDIGTEHRPFDISQRQNSVFWCARAGFDTTGNGKLASSAMNAVKQSRSVLTDLTLARIEHPDQTGRLTLTFNFHKNSSQFVIKCDQLIYSTGQTNFDLLSLCQEILPDCSLHEDILPTCIRTENRSVHFFGAASMAVAPDQFIPKTWKWLKRENIGEDVGPGSMPPSRAQIKKYLTSEGLPVESVNVNIDSTSLIRKLLRSAGVSPNRSSSFIQELLNKRGDGPSGCSHQTLQKLVERYNLDAFVEIRGHSHLVIRESIKKGKG